MKAIKYTNALGHEQILNLSIVSMIEKQTHQKSMSVYFGKDHVHINFKTKEDRDDLYNRICDLLNLS